jgi:hypothetical protein
MVRSTLILWSTSLRRRSVGINTEPIRAHPLQLLRVLTIYLSNCAVNTAHEEIGPKTCWPSCRPTMAVHHIGLPQQQYVQVSDPERDHFDKNTTSTSTHVHN